jgi:hypothetical protein
MQILVSLLVLAWGFHVLAAPNYMIAVADHEAQKWAAGWIGLVVGYWLS